MRIGTNPAKIEDNKVESLFFHQVVIPVYLPKLEGYYKEGLEILKICLESIIITIHDKTFVSVVNNGSCSEVKSYLNRMLDKGKIHEVIHTTSIGKINAISKAISGHNFDLVTITDADVLFVNEWQKAVYEVYEAYPKAGVVGTTPNSKMLKHLTENIHFDSFLNKNLKFRPVPQPEDMRKFANSIGHDKLFNKISLNNILSIKKNKVVATLGTGHFVATYKKDCLKKLRNFKMCNHKMGGKAMREFLDAPIFNDDYWRLSTYENYTFHLGNQVEEWALQSLKNIKYNSNRIKPEKPNFKPHKVYGLIIFKKFIVRKLFFSSYIWHVYLKFLGLNRGDSRHF